MREADVCIERRATPNSSRLNATVIRRRNFGKVRGTTCLEQQGNIAFQRGLIAFGREVIVCLMLDDIGCQCALGQQSVTRDVATDEVTGVKQRNRHTNFIGALLLITALYG